jgi:hypothetical protein
MSRADDAVMRLYENADLRDELTDDEAEALLKWAESEIARIDQAAPDDAAFDTQAEALMDMLKSTNRFAGRQGQLSAQAADPLPASIAAGAAALGHPVSAEQVAASGTGDPASTIRALTAMLSGQPSAEPAEPPPPTDQPPAASAEPAEPPPTDQPPAASAEASTPSPSQTPQPSNDEPHLGDTDL